MRVDPPLDHKEVVYDHEEEEDEAQLSLVCPTPSSTPTKAVVVVVAINPTPSPPTPTVKAVDCHPLRIISQVPRREHFAEQTRDILQSIGAPLLAPRTNAHRGTLVLDLDETLVHSSTVPCADPDYVFPLELAPGAPPCTVYAKKRPFCDEFLRKASSMFEIVVFTASKKNYANRLLDLLDASQFISGRVFRDHCYEFRGVYLKDLELLGREMARTLIVDNSPHAFALHLDNGIPIESWFENPADDQLLRLLGFLERLTRHHGDDYRPALRLHFNLSQAVSQYMAACEV